MPYKIVASFRLLVTSNKIQATRNQVLENGFAHILALLILLVGLGIGVYLVTHPTIFKPKASETANAVPLIPPSHLKCATFYDWGFISPKITTSYLQRNLPKMRESGFNCVYYILDWAGLNPVAFTPGQQGVWNESGNQWNFDALTRNFGLIKGEGMNILVGPQYTTGFPQGIDANYMVDIFGF
jgi:hypothetical protein